MYKSKCFFVINFILLKAELITLLDLSTKAKLSICLILCRPILIITFCYRVLQVMVSKEATFPGPCCKNANILIEGLIWMVTLVSSVLMISVTQWLFVHDRMRSYTGYSSGTTKLKSIFEKNERKK